MSISCGLLGTGVAMFLAALGVSLLAAGADHRRLNVFVWILAYGSILVFCSGIAACAWGK